MRTRPALLAILGLIAVLAMALLAQHTQARLHSSPAVVRTNTAYAEAHAPAVKRQPIAPDFFERIEVAESESEIKINIPEVRAAGPSSPLYEPLLEHQAEESQTVRIGNGSVRLAFVGMAIAPPHLGRGVEVPLKLFKPDLQLATEQDAAGLLPSFDQKTWVHGPGWPVARFFLVHSNTAPLKAAGLRVFDARTRWRLSGSGSSIAQLSDRPLSWFETEVQAWHQTPLELVVTFIGGAVEEFRLPLAAGQEWRHDGCHVRVIALDELGNNSFGTMGDGQTNYHTVRLGAHPAYDNRPRCTVILHSNLQGEIDFVRADGKIADSGGRNSSGGLLVFNPVARLEDLKELRIRYFPQTHRITFKLPELPGLPEANRGIENLFEVRVPWLHFRYEYAFQQTLGQLVQMERMHLPLTYPNGYFPTLRSNTTPRELLIEMAGMLSNPEHHLVADPEKNVIEARTHPLRALFNALKRKVGL
jgi:hypothetical protein